MKRPTAMSFLPCALLAATSLTVLADAAATTVRIHYDAGASGITVRADKGPARKGAAGANVSIYTWPDKLGDVEMKPALRGRESTGGAYKVAASTKPWIAWWGPA